MNRFRISRSSDTVKERVAKSRPKEPSEQGASSPDRPSHSCSRCKRQKRKCSRTLPECEQCAHSATKCSYPAQPTQPELERKIRQLTKFIEDNVDTREGLDFMADDAVLQSEHAGSSSIPDRVIQASESSEMSTPNPLLPDRAVSLDNTSPSSSTQISHAPTQSLPSTAACTRFLDAYFRHVHRVYPFIDKSAVIEDLQNISSFASGDRNPRYTKLYLIMAIGCTTLQRAGQIPDDTSTRFKINYADIIEACLSHVSVESLESLLLLSLYSLFDPSGVSPWSLVGILTRQASAVGITRKVSVSDGFSPSQAELRHRLYWSIFVLDRMLSTSLGLPFGLNDENSDVPLPGITMEEFNAAEPHTYTTSLQICRHIIQLRQLEDTILRSIHLRSAKSVSSLTLADRETIRRELRGQVEDWYSQGCLISPFENDDIPFHNTITWLSVRYYNLLILLYAPSHFSPVASPEQNFELQRCAQRYIQSSCALLSQRRLPLNWVTLYRLLSMCSILIYCYLSGEMEQGETHFLAKSEIVPCAKLLEAFPGTWTVATRSALVFREFASFVVGGGSFAAELRDKWFDQIKAGSADLVREVLGSSSAFGVTDHLVRHPEVWINNMLQQPLHRPRSGLRPLQDVATLSAGGMNAWDGDGAASFGFGIDFF